MKYFLLSFAILFFACKSEKRKKIELEEQNMLLQYNAELANYFSNFYNPFDKYHPYCIASSQYVKNNDAFIKVGEINAQSFEAKMSYFFSKKFVFNTKDSLILAEAQSFFLKKSIFHSKEAPPLLQAQVQNVFLRANIKLYEEHISTKGFPIQNNNFILAETLQDKVKIGEKISILLRVRESFFRGESLAFNFKRREKMTFLDNYSYSFLSKVSDRYRLDNLLFWADDKTIQPSVNVFYTENFCLLTFKAPECAVLTVSGKFSDKAVNFNINYDKSFSKTIYVREN